MAGNLSVRKKNAAQNQKSNVERSFENPMELLSGIASIPRRVTGYVRSNTPMGVLGDVAGIAKSTYESAKEDPGQFIGDAILSPLAAIRDFADVRAKARQLRAMGRKNDAEKLEAMTGAILASAIPIVGRVPGAAVKGAVKGAERGAVKGAERSALKGAEKAIAKDVFERPSVSPIVTQVGERGLPVRGKAQGIIAYHGSPHSFDRFDVSKIGTGEGAQAYGHGLYFAEAEPVAQQYRQRLAEVTAAPFDRIGIPPKEWNAAMMFARQMDPSQPDVAARDFAQWVGRDVTPELVDAFRVAKNPGNMYQVRINADPNELLNWDQPIIAQSPEVQQAALLAAQNANISHLGSGHRARVKFERFMDAAEQAHDPLKGSELMMAIDRGIGNNFTPETSELLKAYGIPGVKYLDQASRATGEGTQNYVVFDDDLINLLRKYAIGGQVTSH